MSDNNNLGAPNALIDSQGGLRQGHFDAPITEINHHDFPLLTDMGKRASALRRYFAFHQFQFMGLFTPRFVIGCALVDTRYVGVAFFYIFDVDNNEFLSQSFQQPLAMSMDFSLCPDDGVMSFRRGKKSISMTGDSASDTRKLVVDLPDAFHLEAELAGGSPMRLCSRAGASGWVYTQKNADQDLRGHLNFKGEDIELSGRGLTDWSAGYMRPSTFWNWAAFSTVLASGVSLGLNLACGVNETSFTENCIWVGGQRHPLSLAHFEYDVQKLREPWRITTADGAIDLSFEPLQGHGERINAVILASNFEQLVGYYRGTIQVEGRTLELDGVLGFAEHHFAKW